MTPQTAVLLALVVSVWLIVLSVGARATLDDATFLFRRPALLVRALIAIFVVVPAFALFVSSAFALSPAIKFALVALAVAPVPPLLPLKQMKVGAGGDYVVGLLVAASVVSIVATPLLVGLAARLLGVEAGIAAGQVARTLLISVGLPLAIGLALRFSAPGAADVVQRYAQRAGVVLLAIGLLIVVVSAWPNVVALVGGGAVLAIAATVVVGLLAGHLLGGGRKGDRGALALAGATRHPGVALAIATASFPEQRSGAAAAVLLFLLVNVAVTTPYVVWMKRRSGPTEAALADP